MSEERSHMPRNGTVLVVGATSSLAQALCRELASQGRSLVLAGRDGDELRLMMSDLYTRYQATCRCVVADFLSPDFTAQALIEQAGDFDEIVIAAGDMGAADPTDIANLAFTMHLNYTIPAQIATLAAWRLSGKRSGSIVILSSVAGDRGRQSNYAYGSAKAALSAFASGLRNRFYKKNVHVMTVKPGFTDTPMTWGMKSPLIASRERVAAAIVRAMEKKKDVVYVPFFWRWIMLIITHIPERIFKKLSL